MSQSDAPQSIIVLVVDDNDEVRVATEWVLRRASFLVHSATNGLEALELLQNGLRPDVILIDLEMPEMNGWEFREAQLQTPAVANVPVVVMSGRLDVTDAAKHLLAAGAVSKPFESMALVALLRNAALATAS